MLTKKETSKQETSLVEQILLGLSFNGKFYFKSIILFPKIGPNF